MSAWLKGHPNPSSEKTDPPLNQFGRFLTFYEEKYGLEPGLDPNNRVRQPQMSRLLNMTSSLVSHYFSREFDHCLEHICKQFPHLFESSNCVYDDSISKDLRSRLKLQLNNMTSTLPKLQFISFETINLCNCYELHCSRHHIAEERAGISLWSSVCRGLVKVNLDPGSDLATFHLSRHLAPVWPLNGRMYTHTRGL